MRYRALDSNGDYNAGPGTAFFVNSPAGVAQAVQTRMRLFTGEWFLNTSEGLNKGLILGERTQGTRDQEIQQRILNTPGVKSILQYVSQVDSPRRTFFVAVTIDTIYAGTATIVLEAL